MKRKEKVERNKAKSASTKRRARKEKIRRQKSVWQKLVDSERHMAAVLCYCGIFMLYGMTDELLGPTLIELSCLASKPLKTMSWLFFSHDLGLLFGTLTGGILAGRVDANLVMSLCLVGNALSVTFIPVLHRFSGMLFFVLTYGLCLGIPDCLSNVMLVKIFGKEVAPYLQGVHFFYGFGAFISPLIARPFLRPACTYYVNTTHFTTNANYTSNTTYDNTSGLWTYNTIEEIEDTTSDICYAYWVISISHIPVVFGLSWLYFRKRLEVAQGTTRGSILNLYDGIDPPQPPPTEEQGSTLDMLPYEPEATFWEKIRKNERSRLLAVTTLCSLIIYLYEGLMAMFGGYIYAYAVKSGRLTLTSDQGAYLTSFYWGFFSVGRFLCIPIAFFITPKSMLMGNVIGCFLSAFVIAAGNSNSNALWIGTCGLGLFLSSAGPTIISMAEQYVELTAQSTSTLVVMSALGELTMPVMVGQAFEQIGPGIVPAMTFVVAFIGLVIFCVLLTLDNDVAFDKATSIWQIIKAIVCCEDKKKESAQYGPIDSNGSVELSSDSDSGIPQPNTYTDVVQPERFAEQNSRVHEDARKESEPLLPQDNYNRNAKE